MPNSDDVEIEAAWLHFVEGLTQAEIAARRGLSRMRVHRLIQAAQDKGYVKVFVDRVPKHCFELEKELMERHGLTTCIVVPIDGVQTMYESLPVIGTASASFLHGMLESTEERVIGIGSGRTIAAASRYLPTINRPGTSFVSATGDFAALSNANPFEVINTLVQKTGGSGYALTAPLVLEAREDRDLFIKQRAVRRTLAMLDQASFFLIGLGHIGPNSYLESYGILEGDEARELERQDVVADVAGHLLNSKGEFISGGLADRMLSVSADVLRQRPVYMACSGLEKTAALRAALKSGLLDGLITTSDLAKAVLAKA